MELLGRFGLSYRSEVCKPTWHLFNNGFWPSVSCCSFSVCKPSHSWVVWGNHGVDCGCAKTLEPNSTWNCWQFPLTVMSQRSQREVIALGMPCSFGNGHFSRDNVSLCDAKQTHYWCDNSLKRVMDADQAPSGQNNLWNGCSWLMDMETAVIFLGILAED